MAGKEGKSMRSILRHHPVLTRLSDMALRLARIRMTIVFPDESGWVQCAPSTRSGFPDFCNMIQSVPEGAKQCRMCHVLMTVASCSSGASRQKCHAGASSLVCPVNPPGHEQSVAVLGSCIFTDEDKEKTWLETAQRGKQLGLDLPALKDAFMKLPVLKDDEIQIAGEILAIASESIKMIFAHRNLLEHVNGAEDAAKTADTIHSVVTERMKAIGETAASRNAKPTTRPKVPPIISVIQETVNKRPDFQYNVAEIAAAARMTPNHFSALFKRHTGRTFSDFVTKRRIAMAKRLLGDFTLNVAEIATKVGFDDPGYFARRFRQIEGCSPREWRENLR